MYVWNESIARRGSQEISSCLLKFLLEELDPKITSIVAYSDCCPGQNLNFNIVKFWMYIVDNLKNTDSIDHKFFEPGHSYNECDQNFALIEKKCKKENNIFAPHHWVDIIKSSNKKFKVTQMLQTDFKSLEEISKRVVKKKNAVDNEPIQWRKIRFTNFSKEIPFGCRFRYDINSSFRFVDFAKNLKGRPPFSSLGQLYNASIKVKLEKWKNLQQLLAFIPPIYHDFYLYLPHEISREEQKRTERNSDFSDSILSSDY